MTYKIISILLITILLVMPFSLADVTDNISINESVNTTNDIINISDDFSLEGNESIISQNTSINLSEQINNSIHISQTIPFFTDVQAICDLSNFNETNSFNCLNEINFLLNVSEERCNPDNFNEDLCWVKFLDFESEYEFYDEGFRVTTEYEEGVLIEEYVYDPSGSRIKSFNNITNTTVYTPFREFMMVVNSSGSYNFTYIYDGSVLVSRINEDGSKWFYHGDHLGSTSLITNESGDVVEETFYLPYGGVDSGGDSEVRLYEGKELDSGTGQYYYGSRYYDPSKRIFIQADSIIPNIYDPQQLNIYGFERGNPYSYVDEEGNLIVYAGGQSSGGAGLGGVVSGGRYFSYTPFSKNYQQGLFGQFGIGFTSPTASGGAVAGFSPLSTAEDFKGQTFDIGFDIGELESIGVGLSFPLDQEGKIQFSKFAIEGTFSADVNIPFPVSVYAVKSTTHTSQTGENWIGNILSDLFNPFSSSVFSSSSQEEVVDSYEKPSEEKKWWQFWK